MKTYTVDEIEGLVESGSYKCVALFSTDGDPLRKYNGSATEGGMLGRWDEIKKYLDTPAMNDPVYLVKLRSGFFNKDPVDTFPMANPNYDADAEGGRLEDADLPRPAPTPYKIPEQIMSQRDLVEMMANVQVLTDRVQRLEEDLAEANEYIDQLEQDAEQAGVSEGQAANSAQNTWGEMFTNMMPVVDKFLVNQAERNNLMKMHLFMQSPEWKAFMAQQMMAGGQLTPQQAHAMAMANSQVQQAATTGGDFLRNAVQQIAQNDPAVGQVLMAHINAGEMDKVKEILKGYGYAA